jgi:hypothetical protein
MALALLILPFVLSIGAFNALIPIFIIVILLIAAGGATRGFNLFAVFGIGTLTGAAGSGRGSFAGKGSYPFRGLLERHIRPEVSPNKKGGGHGGKGGGGESKSKGPGAATIGGSSGSSSKGKERARKWAAVLFPRATGLGTLAYDTYKYVSSSYGEIRGRSTALGKEGVNRRIENSLDAEKKREAAIREQLGKGTYMPGATRKEKKGKYEEGSFYRKYAENRLKLSIERSKLLLEAREKGWAPGATAAGSLVRALAAKKRGGAGGEEEAAFHIKNAALQSDISRSIKAMGTVRGEIPPEAAQMGSEIKMNKRMEQLSKGIVWEGRVGPLIFRWERQKGHKGDTFYLPERLAKHNEGGYENTNKALEWLGFEKEEDAKLFKFMDIWWPQREGGESHSFYGYGDFSNRGGS